MQLTTTKQLQNFSFSHHQVNSNFKDCQNFSHGIEKLYQQEKFLKNPKAFGLPSTQSYWGWKRCKKEIFSIATQVVRKTGIWKRPINHKHLSGQSVHVQTKLGYLNRSIPRSKYLFIHKKNNLIKFWKLAKETPSACPGQCI